MGIKKWFEKSLFFDKNVSELLELYKEGKARSYAKSWTCGLWSYFLAYSKNLIDETIQWNKFIENLNLPKHSAISEIARYYVAEILDCNKPIRTTRKVSILKFKVEKTLTDEIYKDESIKKLKIEIGEHIKRLYSIQNNMEWYVQKKSNDEDSKTQSEFFGKLIPLIQNTVNFLEELKKCIQSISK